MRNSIPAIWSAKSSGESNDETRNPATTSLLFKPGLSAIKVQVGYRFRNGQVFQINGARPSNNTSKDANGISFISLQEIPDNGFITIDIE